MSLMHKSATDTTTYRAMIIVESEKKCVTGLPVQDYYYFINKEGEGWCEDIHSLTPDFEFESKAEAMKAIEI